MEEMSKYIDVDEQREGFIDMVYEQLEDDPDNVRANLIIEYYDSMPKVDAVPKGLFDQIKWERDVAIGQLQEIGCELGQKMDGVKAKLGAVPAVSGRWEWLGTYSHNSEGWVGTCPVCKKRMRLFEKNFCPNCGCRMDGGDNERS